MMRTLCFFTLVCIQLSMFSQSIEKYSIDSGGESNVSGSLEILFTLGEVNIQEINTASLIVSEGFINPIVVGPTLSIQSNEGLVDLLVYPNPTSDILNIQTSHEIGQIKVYDMTSKVLLEKTNVNVINCNYLASGNYVLEVYINRTPVYKKLIIK